MRTYSAKAMSGRHMSNIALYLGLLASCSTTELFFKIIVCKGGLERVFYHPSSPMTDFSSQVGVLENIAP